VKFYPHTHTKNAATKCTQFPLADSDKLFQDLQLTHKVISTVDGPLGHGMVY